MGAVADAGHRLVGAVTQPDRPRGRGRKLESSPVRRAAEALRCPVLVPDRPRGEAFEQAVRALEPDVSVVVAYGHILTRAVLDLPRLGSINLHASLLPELRGAAPIQWAIARGHAETGATVMRMVRAMDAGPVLAQERTPIRPDETASELAGRLSRMGGRLVADVLDRMGAGPAPEIEQDHDAATYAPKINRDSARIDWTRDARAVAGLVRAMDAVPGAWTRLADRPIKLFRPQVVAAPGAPPCPPAPGAIVRADPQRGLHVAAGDGIVRFGEVQPAGKRRMDAAAWLRGTGLSAGERFGGDGMGS